MNGLDDMLPHEGRSISHATQTAGGMIDVLLKLRDGDADVVDQALITGDFFAEPPAAIAGLEARLRGHRLAELEAAAHAYLDAAPARFLALDTAGFAAAIGAAAEAARSKE